MVSEAEDEDTELKLERVPREVPEVPEGRRVDSDHMMLLYASPLCFRDGRGMMPLPQIPVEKEWETVLASYNEASHILSRTSSSPGVSISAQTLTAGSLQRATISERSFTVNRSFLFHSVVLESELEGPL